MVTKLKGGWLVVCHQSNLNVDLGRTETPEVLTAQDQAFEDTVNTGHFQAFPRRKASGLAKSVNLDIGFPVFKNYDGILLCQAQQTSTATKL